MTFYAFIGVAVTSATVVVFGKAIWDPVQLMQRFHSPVREMIRPVVMLETSRPPTIAMDISPAWVGVIPRAIWKYCER